MDGKQNKKATSLRNPYAAMAMVMERLASEEAGVNRAQRLREARKLRELARNELPPTSSRSSSMCSTKQLQEAFGRRIEAVIEGSDDPQATMAEIALKAERQGLVDSEASIRRSSPTEFVMDLWLENPVIHDRLNLSRKYLPSPGYVTDLPGVLDILR